jgi:ubiquitin fusion degradation protein 1
MMQNLLLQEGDVITLRNATLPKGTYVKLQPHSKDFLDISNPRAVLETTLRNFSCLSVGDTIPIQYNNRKYFIDIVEAKPADAISVIETDCNVDFAPPLDYVEPAYAAMKAAADAAAAAPVPMATDDAGDSQAQPEEEQGAQFLAFAGSGMRLDGKPVSASNPVAVPLAATGTGSRPRLLPNNSSKEWEGGAGSAPKAGSAPGGRKAGKLMFKDRLAAKFGDGKVGAKTGHGFSEHEGAALN